MSRQSSTLFIVGWRSAESRIHANRPRFTASKVRIIMGNGAVKAIFYSSWRFLGVESGYVVEMTRAVFFRSRNHGATSLTTSACHTNSDSLLRT